MNEVLIRKAKKGDKDAFCRLMDENVQSMYKIAAAYLKNDEDVADAIQDTILSCYENLRRAVNRKRQRKTVSLPYGRKRRKPSTEEDNMKIEWILCPFCGSKTRLKIRYDTVLENFPLYCPKCKHETLITVRKLNLSIVQEPDAQTQSR